ncbi:putative A1 cistron-splicing factor, AAR2 [Helianthus annuus]|nr:putative A1 cistron-splicing factor, AAR2 [Helianthus annuus]
MIIMQIFSVGPNFKGIKMIPPGPHFVYYSSSNRWAVIVRKWDPQEERLVKVPEEERYSQAVKSLEFDKYLGPYTLSQYGEWKMLSNYITKGVIERIGNLDGTHK